MNPAEAPNEVFSVTAWVIFNIFVLAMLALDLGVFNRKAHTIKFKEALGWTILWVTLAMGFNAWLYYDHGPEIGHEFLMGYILEKSLSVDNIFVFIMLFTYFKIEPKYQHRLLFWGILGALILRGIMIAAGAALIYKFAWVLYIFGAFLIFTGIKMALHDDENADPSNSIVYRYAKKFLPVAEGDYGQRFFVKIDGKTYVTTLFVVLLVIETTDVVFALDSIPAIFGVTTNTFIIYTSNVFAILGLRAMYFMLAGVMDLFRYLKYGLSLVLVFVGCKMIVQHAYKDGYLDQQYITTNMSLAVIASIIALSIILSLLFAKREDHKKELEHDND